jgi:hypothetical protein
MKKLPYLFFLFLISCFRTETPLETIILLNDGWEFKKLEADDADWRPANVPGTVHTDLLLNGEIEDPFYACNEKELQWIGTNDWIYRKSFYIDDEILINQHITPSLQRGNQRLPSPYSPSALQLYRQSLHQTITSRQSRNRDSSCF